MNRKFQLEVQEMAAMFFHVEERRAWIRTGTHTVVYDRDPNYGRFAEDPRGTVIRMLRIWLAEPKGDRPYLRAYLGTVTLCFIGPSFRDLCRLFRFTSRAAKAAGQSAKALRHNLAGLLRERIHEAYREKQLRKVQQQELHGEKKEIGWGSQIRSYVLQPYRLAKDHRTNHEIGNVDAVLDGNIDPFIKAFLLWQP